jgi:hypothetical protein
MKVLTLITAVVLVVFLGCTEQPLEPEWNTDTPSALADETAKNGAVKTVEIMEWDATGAEFYLECLGETVTYFGTLDWEQTTTELPSGQVHVTGKLLYSQTYGFTSSGDHTWLLVHGTQNSHERITSTGGYSVHFSLHEWYENELGERMLQVGVYGLRLNEAGESVFEKFHGWCPGAPDTEFSYL